MSGVGLTKLLLIDRENNEFIYLIDKGILKVHQAYIQVTRNKKERESREENRKNGFDTGDSNIRFFNKGSSQMDEIKDGEIRDQILKNSPEKNEEFFVVPKVIE